MNASHPHTLKARPIGIDTYGENIIYMRADCHICLSEGLTSLTRLVVQYGNKTIVATLNVVTSDLLVPGEAGLSEIAFQRLEVTAGDHITISHLKPIESLGRIRAKMYGEELKAQDFREIMTDIAAGRYSNVELAAFITACADDHLSISEITGLTKAMIDSGERINWNEDLVLDKHCIGGLPGNRTTPIVVSIVAAAGLIIPKTSSRAITSPSGTADTMEVMAPVNLSIQQIRKVVKKEGGCIAWGGGMKLSPADDVLIAVEKALDVDSAGQMIASVLSKKAAAGSKFVLIDMPVGPTAKVRSQEEALKLEYYFKAVARAVGLNVEVILTDGSQPIGRGIGPSLEAMDILSVLRNERTCPSDLKEKSIQFSGLLLELSGKFPLGRGEKMAREILETGKALSKFMAICKAQGGFREPVIAPHRYDVFAERDGAIVFIDNRKLARVAKLAGAPRSISAGIQFYSPLGKKVKKGDLLYSVFAEAMGELEYARDYLLNTNGLITIQ
jgi:thymidine phosphorylase